MWRNLSTSDTSRQICFVTVYVVLFQNQFVCFLGCFVKKDILLLFTRFCLRGEKLNKKLCPRRKKDKYEEWELKWAKDV